MTKKGNELYRQHIRVHPSYVSLVNWKSAYVYSYKSGNFQTRQSQLASSKGSHLFIFSTTKKSNFHDVSYEIILLQCYLHGGLIQWHGMESLIFIIKNCTIQSLFHNYYSDALYFTFSKYTYLNVYISPLANYNNSDKTWKRISNNPAIFVVEDIIIQD